MNRVLMLLCVLVLAGCVPRQGTATTVVATGRLSEGRLHVIHDDQRGVTCYWMKQGYGAGLSCIPDSALRNSGAQP